MKYLSRVLWAITASTILIFSIPASATLIGDNVDYERYRENGTVDAFSSFTVSNGIDFVDCIYDCGAPFPFNGRFDVDVSSNGLYLEYSGNTVLFAAMSRDTHHIRLSSLNWQNISKTKITSVNADWGGLSNNIYTSEFSLNDITFGDDFVDISIGGLIFGPNDFIEVTFEVATVPEPASIWLFSIGAISIFLRCRLGNSIKRVRKHAL